MPKRKPAKSTLLVFVVLAIALLINLDQTPPPWWDEGWTLIVAKTLALHGLYARPLNGVLGPSGLSAQPPTTALVALAFKVLGVGLAQARLAMAFLTWLTFAVLYLLVSQLYDRRMALATLAAGCLMSMHPQANPITMGRQVLAEPLMLLLLLVGSLFLYLALQRSIWFIAPALFCWGLVPVVKAQVLPFWAASLAVPLGAVLLKRQWRSAAIMGLGIVGGYFLYQLSLLGLGAWLSPRVISEAPVSGLVDTLAFVPVLANRLLAISNVIKFEIPLLIGLGYGAWAFFRSWSRPGSNQNTWAVQLSLWSFAASWLAWYLLFANAGIPRYLYPPAFVGSIFVALLLRDLTDGFQLRRTLERAAFALGHLRFGIPAIRALSAIFLVALAVPFTLLTLIWFFTVDTNTSVQQMAQYIDSHAPPNALIESYDSELFFFLEHPYHYPPDQTHLNLIRRTLDSTVDVNYDPLATNPDYLVVGPFGTGWQVYDGVLAGNEFRLMQTVAAYRLYERVR